METTFLKIARVALMVILTLSLLFTVCAAVYGAMEFLPNSAQKTPDISVTSRDANQQKATTGSDQSLAPSSENDAESKALTPDQCSKLVAKINQTAEKIGWGTKQEPVLNQITMQTEMQQVIDYDTRADQGRFCTFATNFITQQNAKLSPYIEHPSLSDNYYRDYNSYLDEILKESSRLRDMPANDPNKLYASTVNSSFHDKFSSATDDAAKDLSGSIVERAAGKARGLIAIYAAGSAFVFFFMSCLILVFIRLEVNTRNIAELLRAYTLPKS
jgi:hypothetical protein